MSADMTRTVFCGEKPYLPDGMRGRLPDRQRVCCFTGHRPEKLPTGAKLERLRELVAEAAELLTFRGVDTFITGMAPGFDLLAAETILNCRFDGVKLVCAVPYRGHIAEARRAGDERLYNRALTESVLIPYFFENWDKNCYRVRNRFMVNHSAHIIGYVKDYESFRNSGTGMTIRMAKKDGLNRIIITGDRL